MVLAAAIAWLLHRAFVVPFVLAGISATLLAETRGRTPDPDLCKKLDSLVRPRLRRITGQRNSRSGATSLYG